MSSRPIRGAARLAAILDALPDALLLVNSNGTVVDANNAAVQSLQAPGTSLVGMGVLDLLPEFDPSRIPGSMRPAPREDDALDRPVRMTARRTDGTAFPVEVSGNDFADDGASEGRGYALSPLVPYDPYRDTPRQSSGSDLLLLLVRDLSSRLGVEAELRRQHKQTEMILRAAAEGVLGVDLEGRCVLVNPAAAHILEYRASELGGRELHPLIQHSKADGTPLTLEESALLDTLTSGRKHRVRGAVLWRKDGRPVTVDLTTAPVRDGDQLVGAVMTFTDRSRELALVARNEHLTAVLESELGGALTALHRRIDALAGDPAGQLWPEANWTLRRLADECRRFGKLIDGVLSYQSYEAGAENGQNAPEREPVGLDEVVRRAVEHAGELVGAGRVRFSVHAAAVEVIADEERLAQALAHLVADVSGVALSLDAVPVVDGLAVPAPAGPAELPPSGGEAPMVVLAAAQRGEVARVEIRGPGLGPSPVHLPIARSVVERHGGVLQSHELPNRAGTTYVVELPLDPVAAKAAAERAAAGGRRDTPKESDTAVLPDLPGIPQLPSGERTTEGDGTDDTGAEAAGKSPAARPAAEQAPEEESRTGRGRRAARAADPEHWQDAPAPRTGQGGGTGTGVTLGRTVPEQWNGDGADAGYGRAAADQGDRAEHDPWRGGDNGGTAYAVPAGESDRAAGGRDSGPDSRTAAQSVPKAVGGAIALGPGPSAAPAEPERPAEQPAPERGPLALGPAGPAPEPAADPVPAQGQGASRQPAAPCPPPARSRRPASRCPACPTPAPRSTPVWSTRSRPDRRPPYPSRARCRPPAGAAGWPYRRVAGPRPGPRSRARSPARPRPCPRRPPRPPALWRSPGRRCRRATTCPRPRSLPRRPAPRRASRVRRSRWAAGWASCRRRVRWGPAAGSPAPSRPPRPARSPSRRRAARRTAAHRWRPVLPRVRWPSWPPPATASPPRHRAATRRPPAPRPRTGTPAGCWSGRSPTRPPSRPCRTVATTRSSSAPARRWTRRSPPSPRRSSSTR
nr:PAS domain-containing protein [Kitasatospora herbaricolor]